MVPGAATRSYLLHKVLPGYPDRVGEEMPPPGAAPLAPEERRALLRALQRWIDGL